MIVPSHVACNVSTMVTGANIQFLSRSDTAKRCNVRLIHGVDDTLHNKYATC